MRESDVTLEFQITSNVRLNNLSFLEKYPLRQYLQAGIRCVQGTDGSALYGTNPIDEDLSLEKLLGLGIPELAQMKQGERELLDESREVFERKQESFRAICAGNDIEQYYERVLERTEKPDVALWKAGGEVRAESALQDRLAALPEKGCPVVICGGSFNSSRRRTTLRKEDRELIDGLQNSWISSSVPGVCPANWLQGTSMISRPWS